MRIPIAHMPPVIPVGVQTESGVEDIGVDVSPWLAKWPGMTVAVWLTRPGEMSAYPAGNVQMDGNVLIWRPDGYDTAIPGSGKMEILGLTQDGEKRKLTGDGVTTMIRSTTLASTAEPGVAEKPWVDKVLDAAQRAEDAADRAEGAAGGSVPIATKDCLGVIKVGDGLSITDDGMLSAQGGGSGTVTPEQVQEAVNEALQNAKDSGEFDGPPGESGVYMGSAPPTDPNVKVWINPEGEVDPEDGTVEVDETLSVPGMAADAAAVGKKVAELTEEIAKQQSTLNDISIEGYERAAKFVSVVDKAEKNENAYLYRKYQSPIGYVATPVTVANWNWYELPVNEGEQYHLITWCGNQPAGAYILSDTGAIMQMLPDPLPSTAGVYETEFVIPAGAKTIRVNQQTQKTFVLERLGGQSLHFVRSENAKVSEDHLYGKKLACVGDSITEATNPDGGYFTNYAEIAAARHNMTVYKDGKGGSTMTNVEGKNPFCVNRYLSVPADFDILTIWFGWNDNAFAEVGTIEDTEDTTYYGAYKKVMDYFITTYPTKKIGLIVPYGNDSVEPFRVAVRALSVMYGVPCLDLADGKQCSMLWGTANAAQEARRAALTYDGTHPNQVGHEYLSTMYEEFIKRL